MSAKGSSLRDTLLSAENALKGGDLPRAITAYAHILAQAPNHTKAQKAVMTLRRRSGKSAVLTQRDVDEVVQMLGTGRLSEAADHARLLLVVAPREALVHNILGMALASGGKPRAALSAFQSALRINPGYAEAHGNLGSALVQLEQFDKALPHLDKALSINANLPEVLNNLAAVQRQQGHFAPALLSIDKALALRADYANALNTKGTILLKLERPREAIECYNKGLALQPGDGDMLMNLGFAFEAKGDTDQAIATLTEARDTAATPAEIEHRLGVIFGQLGDKKQAIAHYTAAIAIDPAMGEAYRNLGTINRFEAGDALMAQMRQQLDRKDATDDMRMHLGFALGKALEDCGDYAQSFACLKIGNREKRKQVLPYSTAQQTQLIDTIKSTFSAEFIASLAPAASNSQQPIFVLGMPRSGTTLVEQILASHTQVFGAGEQSFVDKFAQQNLGRMTSLPKDDLRAFGATYLEEMRALAGAARHITDKLPANFHWVGLIAGLFPNARIVNLMRDPRDNCLSIWKNYFSSGGNQYAYDLTELGEFYVLYRELMTYWESVLPGRIMTLSYEALTRDQETQSRRLLSFCGLDWEDRVLAFHKTKRDIKTASVGQVRQKIYTSSVQSWKHYEQELTPLFDVLERANYLPGDTR